MNRHTGNETVYRNAQGQLHRKDGPAIANGDKEEWWLNGTLHRDGGPAISSPTGFEMWFRNGEKHREDGPALTASNGDTEYWQNGMRHRLDGPAMTFAASSKSSLACGQKNKWWIRGKRITSRKHFQEIWPVSDDYMMTMILKYGEIK